MTGEQVVEKNYWDSFIETGLKVVLDEIGTEQLIFKDGEFGISINIIINANTH